MWQIFPANEQDDGKASFDPDEWPAIRDAIENAFKIALE
jgi:hypothetical protein